MARFRDLPPELVAAILAVLPVDSLMQSKCVQKSWCSLISHPSFVTKQLHNQIHSKNTGVLFKGLIVTGPGKVKDFLSFFSFDKKAGTSAGQDHVSAVWKTVDFPFFRELMFSRFLGHCHGAIFLAFCNGELLLANLATREIKALPETLILPSVGSIGPKKFPACVGFGYDLKSNDYEVVIIHLVIDNSVFHKVKVYTLSTKSWREVSTTNILGTDNFDYVGCGGLYINGASYWLAYGDFFKKYTKFILSFDMSGEVFQKLSMPCYDEGEDFRVMVFNESLAYLHSTYECPCSFTIWVLDEFGANATWKKLLMIEPNPRLRSSLIFWNNELIMNGKDGMMCCYNLDTQEIKDIPVPTRSKPYYLAVYLSSLVSVKCSGIRLAYRRLLFDKE